MCIPGADRAEHSATAGTVGRFDTLYTDVFAFQWMALGDLKFYKKTVSGEELLKSVRWLTEFPLSYKEESADWILDAYSSTGYRMDLDKKYADLDLGECCRLVEVSFLSVSGCGVPAR